MISSRSTNGPKRSSPVRIASANIRSPSKDILLPSRSRPSSAPVTKTPLERPFRRTNRKLSDFSEGSTQQLKIEGKAIGCERGNFSRSSTTYRVPTKNPSNFREPAYIIRDKLLNPKIEGEIKMFSESLDNSIYHDIENNYLRLYHQKESSTRMNGSNFMINNFFQEESEIDSSCPEGCELEDRLISTKISPHRYSHSDIMSKSVISNKQTRLFYQRNKCFNEHKRSSETESVTNSESESTVLSLGQRIQQMAKEHNENTSLVSEKDNIKEKQSYMEEWKNLLENNKKLVLNEFIPKSSFPTVRFLEEVDEGTNVSDIEEESSEENTVIDRAETLELIQTKNKLENKELDHSHVETKSQANSLPDHLNGNAAENTRDYHAEREVSEKISNNPNILEEHAIFNENKVGEVSKDINITESTQISNESNETLENTPEIQNNSEQISDTCTVGSVKTISNNSPTPSPRVNNFLETLLKLDLEKQSSKETIQTCTTKTSNGTVSENPVISTVVNTPQVSFALKLPENSNNETRNHMESIQEVNCGSTDNLCQENANTLLKSKNEYIEKHENEAGEKAHRIITEKATVVGNENSSKKINFAPKLVETLNNDSNTSPQNSFEKGYEDNEASIFDWTKISSLRKNNIFTPNSLITSVNKRKQSNDITKALQMIKEHQNVDSVEKENDKSSDPSSTQPDNEEGTKRRTVNNPPSIDVLIEKLSLFTHDLADFFSNERKDDAQEHLQTLWKCKKILEKVCSEYGLEEDLTQTEYFQECNKKFQDSQREMEERVRKNLSLITKLLDDKKTLTEKCEELSQALTKKEQTHLNQMKLLRTQNDSELKNLREKLLASEKTKREKWAQSKCKMIKDSSYRSLEAKLKDLSIQHREEATEQKEAHRKELLELEDKWIQKLRAMEEDLKAKHEEDVKTECQKEKMRAEERYNREIHQQEKDYENKLISIQKQFFSEKAEWEEAERKKMQSLKLDYEREVQSLKRQLSDMRSDCDGQIKCLIKGHENEISTICQTNERFQAQWEDQTQKKFEEEKQRFEKDLRDRLRRQRDVEIEKIISEFQQETEKQLEEKKSFYNAKLKNQRDRYEAEFQDLEACERLSRTKYLEMKRLLTQREEEIVYLKARLHSHTLEMNDIQQMFCS